MYHGASGNNPRCRETPVPPSWSTLRGRTDFEITPETPRRDRPPSRGTFAPALRKSRAPLLKAANQRHVF